MIAELILALGRELSELERRRRTRELARKLGLDCDDDWIEGDLTGLDVRIRLGVEWVIHLERSPAFPDRFAIEPVFLPRQGSESGPRSFRGRELRRAGSLHWQELDNSHEAVWIGAEGGALGTLLTGSVRAALARMTSRWKVRLDEHGLRGELCAKLSARTTAAEIRALAPALDALRQELGRSMDGLFDRLLPLALGAESVAARRDCLRALQHRFPSRPETREASRAASLSPSPELRVTGASFLGADGSPLLVALACDRALAAEVRLEAFRALAEGAPEDARRVLEPLLTQPGCPAPLLEAAMAAAMRLEHREVAPAIAALAAREPALGAGIARALERLGDSSCEPALLALLAVEDSEVRISAARALAVQGGLSAVEPLLLAAREKALTNAMRTAARTIQARLAGDAPGGLTITGIEDGAISIALPADGGVSLVQGPRPDGALSGSESPTSRATASRSA